MNKEETFSNFPLGMQLAFLSRRWRSVIDCQMLPLGLTQSRWEVLFQLERLGPGTIQSELATALGIEMPSLTRSLDQLESQQLIYRQRDKKDKRARSVFFTEKGAELQSKARSIREQVYTHTLQDISEDEMNVCFQVLCKLNQNLTSDMDSSGD